jgi:hypothetical protein
MIEKQLKDANKPVATLSWRLAYTLMVFEQNHKIYRQSAEFSCSCAMGLDLLEIIMLKESVNNNAIKC